MRIVPIGVSHWHTPFFLDPCLEMADVEIVGIADLSRTEAAASKAKCPVFADYREMCAKLKPDFALARHCDMAELARFPINSRLSPLPAQ